MSSQFCPTKVSDCTLHAFGAKRSAAFDMQKALSEGKKTAQGAGMFV
jgi:hypothetical protein